MRHSALKTLHCCWSVLIIWTISKIKISNELCMGVYTIVFLQKTIAEADVPLSDGFIFLFFFINARQHSTKR